MATIPPIASRADPAPADRSKSNRAHPRSVVGASTLRWRFVQKPDPFYLEWARVDGKLAFETDGLIGDPTTAAKLLEFRGVVDTSRIEGGEQIVIVELVERDPANRSGEPAKRLEFVFEVMVPKDCCRIQFS